MLSNHLNGEASPHTSRRQERNGQKVYRLLPPNRREVSLPVAFRELAEEFRRSLAWAKQHFGALRYTFGCCNTPSDFQAFAPRDDLAALAGASDSYRELLDQFLPIRSLTRKQLADFVGYFLLPQAARLTLRAFRRKSPIEPIGLWRAASLSGAVGEVQEGDDATDEGSSPEEADEAASGADEAGPSEAGEERPDDIDNSPGDDVPPEEDRE